jgi:trehalose 6-phosphate synthase
MQMSLEERCERWQAMMEVLRRNNAKAWRKSFLCALHPGI